MSLSDLHTVVVPTFNNPQQLHDTLLSLVTNSDFQGRVLVVNNGDPGKGYYEQVQAAVPYEVDWLEPGKNLGWMGGINAALENIQSEYVTMLNDDVLFPPESRSFWEKTLRWFHHYDVGGVGPSSNFVAGAQSAFLHLKHAMVTVPYLIGFCATYRTDLLKELGGLDESLPGGDDLDLSIRVKDSGRDLIADRRLYLHHIGQQTGHRVHPGFWDSQAHQADTYNALIRKHGLARWYQMMTEEAFSIHTEDPRATAIKVSRWTPDPLTKRYCRLRLTPSDVDAHMDVLHRFASGCKHVTEFGTNDGTTATALLYAQPDTLECYDLVRFVDVSELESMAGRTNFVFHERGTTAGPINDTDFLFIDDLHTGEHLRLELAMHADKVRKYIGFHDTVLFGARGELEGTEGLWPVISDFMRENPQWRIAHHNEASNGLLILAR